MSGKADAAIADFMTREKLGPRFAETVARVYRPLAVRIESLARTHPGLIVGFCGSQGSGKSTGVALLKILLEAEGLRTATLSIDDLYLSKEARQKLAEEVHPLLATRGPPGTHDVALGEEVLNALPKSQAVSIPRFDKARDTRMDPSKWDQFQGPADVILFEGWCVDARPQPPEALAEPVNALERNSDPDGRWRAYVNDALAGPYQHLFGRIGFLVFLAAPSFEVVAGWRKEQEAKLRARTDGSSHVMSDDEIDRFVQFYERLTRFMLTEMPSRADAVVHLGANREPLELDIHIR
ncbi:MAG: kinase [Proteobacteria bacterium]|nr:kinase [Pseudomonadota bacterium]